MASCYKLKELAPKMQEDSKKRSKDRCLRDSKKYSFPQRNIEAWNSLSEGVISTRSVDNFKEKFDKYRYRDSVSPGPVKLQLGKCTHTLFLLQNLFHTHGEDKKRQSPSPSLKLWSQAQSLALYSSLWCTLSLSLL